MAYQDIPLATDQLSQSQSDIRGNFSWLATNGIANLTPTYLLFPVQGSDPTVSSGQIALYSKTVSGNADLFTKNASGTVVDWSKGATSATSGSNGWTYLPSGALMTWGRSAIPVGGSVSIVFNGSGGLGSFPGFVTNSCVTITQGVNNALPANPIFISAYTASGGSGGFTAQSTTTYNFFWTAVGI